MSNSSNNGKGNGKEREELVFELSPIQTYDVTFIEKSKGKDKVGEFREKGKAKGKDRSRDKGKCLARVKGEYQFSTRTITVEMDDEDIKELAKDLNVVKIEPDFLVKPSAVYSEPFHTNTNWMLGKVGAKTAFANGISGQGVKVAVLDSGVDTDNPMLAHAVRGGASVVEWSTDYEDLPNHGHGTMVAGIIAGKHQGNAYGVAPDVDLYAVKIVFSAENDGALLSDMAKGVEWAVNNGMDAINISFDSQGYNDALNTAIARAYNLGIPVFNAGGNSNEDIDSMSDTQTRCNNDGVYCVLALKKDDLLADFSAYGDDDIAFSTYGDNVAVVGVNNPNPTTSSGTSFASPLAMGIFALYKCKYPNLNGNQIIEMMKTNGRNSTEYNDLPVANSPLYVSDAVTSVSSQTPSIPTLTLLSTSGNRAIIRASVPSTSATFNKLIIDNRWTSDTSDRVITIRNSTRSYDFMVDAPAFNTEYQTSVKVVNGSLESGWSSALTFTTTSASSNITPYKVKIEYLSNDGLNVTYRATVPESSPTFNRLNVNYYWTTHDNPVLNFPHTRLHDFTITLPSYKASYSISAKAFNGTAGEYFSDACTISIADDSVTTMPLKGKLGIVSINGKSVKFRAEVPNYSPKMDMLSVYYSWNDRFTGGIDVPFSKTRAYEWVVDAPDYNTTYNVFAFPWNGEVGGYGINNIDFTTTSPNTPVAPVAPTLSVVSIVGKTVTIKATVPKSTVMFDKLDFDYYWVSNYPNASVTMSSPTVSYEHTFEAPAFNTEYQIDVRAYSGTLNSNWSAPLAFKTGIDNSLVLPETPTISLLSVNGKTVTVRVTVPNSSATFNKLQFDYYSAGSGQSTGNIVTIPNTRTYDLVFDALKYNSGKYFLHVKVSNGDGTSAFSNVVEFTTGSEVITPVAPVAPTLSLVSVNGKTATIRATVPSTSEMFNKLSLDYRWLSDTYDRVITMGNTRSYDFTVDAPDYNTTYQIDAKAHNGDLESGWSNVLSFTTGVNNTPVAPATPTLSLISVNGKNITVRATVPSTSATFNKLQFDYYWVSGTSDKVVTMSNTRTYDLTFEAPNFNTTYEIDAKAFNGDLSSSWSNKLAFTTGADNTIVAPATPTLSLISVNGKEVKIRATVPSSSATFNKLEFDYYWVSGTVDNVVTMGNTRTYDLTLVAPAYNTTYEVDAKAYNGTLSSSWSSKLQFTTGADNKNITEDFSDNTFNFNFTGDWYRDTTTNTYRSKAVSPNGKSTTTFVVDGGTSGANISLDYKVVASQGWDAINIYVNNSLIRSETGVNSFMNFYSAIGAGLNTIKIEYVKNGTTSSSDGVAEIDNIQVRKY